MFETPVISEDECGRLGLAQSGQTLHLLGVPPIAALTFYFPSLRSIVKSLLANQPQRLASEPADVSHSIHCFFLFLSTFILIDPKNIIAVQILLLRSHGPPDRDL